MAFGLGLFGTISGLKEEAINGAIVGASALVGLGIARAITAKAAEMLPAAVAPYAGAIPFVGALATAMYARRFDARVAVGAAGGMAAYGLFEIAKNIPGVKDLVGKVDMPLKGLGEMDLSYTRYLAGAPVTIDSLQGAPTTIESLRGGISRRAAATLS